MACRKRGRLGLDPVIIAIHFCDFVVVLHSCAFGVVLLIVPILVIILISGQGRILIVV